MNKITPGGGYGRSEKKIRCTHSPVRTADSPNERMVTLYRPDCSTELQRMEALVGDIFVGSSVLDEI